MAQKNSKKKLLPDADIEAFLESPDNLPVLKELEGFGSFYIQKLTSAERGAFQDEKDPSLKRIILLQSAFLQMDKKTPLFTTEQAASMVAKRSNIPELLCSLAVVHMNVNDDPSDLGNGG